MQHPITDEIVLHLLPMNVLLGITTRPLAGVTLEFESQRDRHTVAGRVEDDHRSFDIGADDDNPWVLHNSGTYGFVFRGTDGADVPGGAEPAPVEEVVAEDDREGSG